MGILLSEMDVVIYLHEKALIGTKTELVRLLWGLAVMTVIYMI